MSKYGVISGPYFPAFGLNTEIQSFFLRFSRLASQQKKLTSLDDPRIETVKWLFLDLGVAGMIVLEDRRYL